MTWQYIVVTIADLYAIILVIYCCLTWIPARPGTAFEDVTRFFAAICEPFLAPFRKIIPPIGGMMDISPIVALLVLQFGVRFLVSLF